LIIDFGAEPPRSIRFKNFDDDQHLIEVTESEVNVLRPLEVQGRVTLNSSISSLVIEGDKITGSGTLDNKKQLLLSDFEAFSYKPETIEHTEEIATGVTKSITFEKNELLPDCIFNFD